MHARFVFVWRPHAFPVAGPGLWLQVGPTVRIKAAMSGLSILTDAPDDVACGTGVKDGRGRTVRYLRMSATDRCDMACVYCMPVGYEGSPKAELLSFEEMVRVVGAFHAVGVRTVRRTGSLMGVAPTEKVANRIVQAIERGEREVYITCKDRLFVWGANLAPGLFEWAMIRFRHSRIGTSK